MNSIIKMGEKSDASTTTDDMQMPPLCLFYFSHPFGILSPDPPRVSNPNTEGCCQHSWMQTIQAQSWTVQGEGLMAKEKKSMATKQKNNLVHCLANAKPNLKVKKIKSHPMPKRNGNSNKGSPKCDQCTRICNKYVNTDDIKSDECDTFDEESDDNIADTASKVFEGRGKVECENLTCCGDTHLMNAERNFVRPKNRAIRVIEDNPQLQKKILPPLERPKKLCEEDTTYKKWLDVDHQRNNFRLKAFLPPIEPQDLPYFTGKPPERSKEDSDDDDDVNGSNVKIRVENMDDVVNGYINAAGVVRKVRRKRNVKRRRSSVNSSGGVNKARSRPHRSAARKLVNCLLQSVSSARRAPTATLPALSEVLTTVREAWTSPKSLRHTYNSSPIPMSTSPGRQQIAMLDTKERCAARAGASPGLLRRRYSVPETVMRKYKLAQLKSDTEESDIGSAPSPPRGFSPAKRLGSSNNHGSKGFLGSVRPSPLLRRLWGRQGGSNSELRYWDYCSGNSGCESCKRSEKNVTAVKTETGLPTSPVHKIYRMSRSPKKINPYCSQGFSPERYITHLENARDMLMRETKPQLKSPIKYKTGGSAPSERSSFKSVSEGSPKLGLSSLATSSYPVTDGNSVSDVTSEVTRSSTSYSSDENTKYKVHINRPLTAECFSRNETFRNTSDTTKKRRQSVCIYMNSRDSPTVEIKSSTITSESSHPTTQESLKLSELNISNTDTYSTPTSKDYETESLQIIDDLNSSGKTLTTTSSSACDKSSSSFRSIESDTPVPQTTSTSETLVTSETKTTETLHTTDTSTTSRTTTSTTHNDDISRNDSALSTRTSLTTDDGNVTKSPQSDKSHKERKDTKNKEQVQNAHIVDLSDTGISLNDDTNRNSFNSGTSEAVLSKPGSASESSTVVSETVTFIENPGRDVKQDLKNHLKNTKLECIEVVVSETLNSSAFYDNLKSKSTKECSSETKPKKKDTPKNIYTPDDIDQYVSNILMDSLNSMTNQIQEINSNSEDDIKLNILEKEIKVKLQNLCSSQMNNTIISSLITNIPDDELLETTIIEEKSSTLAYSTEEKLFSLDNTMTGNNDGISSEYIPTPATVNLKNDMSESESSPDFESMNFVQTKTMNNNYSDIMSRSKDDDGLHFYLNDLNENIEENETLEDGVTKKAILDKLNKMFENPLSVDTNFNICMDNPANNYFCDSVYRDASHLEMSTDVDVFVDNSLNKMINSIDLCSDVQNLGLDNGNDKTENTFQPINNEVMNNNLGVQTDNEIVRYKKINNKENKKIISNIGSGSLYQKSTENPLVVPRFSAIPNTESMEVNTSSDEDVSSCESDCLSLIDSLDDPNSPRLLEISNIRRTSKHDKTPVRGGIIAMLPENTTHDRSPTKEKSETYFIPIKGDESECLKESVVVAEHMPEKLKEKLLKRQQKREMRKEHRKKKMKQLKKESETQKDSKKIEPKEPEPKPLVNRGEERLRNNDENKAHVKNKSIVKENPKKEEPKTKELRAFVIDKRGDIKMTNSKKSPEKESKKDSKQNNLKSKSETHNEKYQRNDMYIPRECDFPEPRYNPNLSGPRRLYQKTEFKEGNKHVEILEIVECVESSPEPQIYDYGLYEKENSGKKSKIPIPVLERLHRTSKRKPSSKLLRRCKSPVRKSMPFNILAAMSDQNHNKNVNTKVDQIIANILIDAINEDCFENSNFRVISPIYDKKPMHPVVKKLVSAELNAKKVLPPSNIDKATLTKFKQCFDVIPEERSSQSVDSQSEDSKNKKQSTGENSGQTTASSTKPSKESKRDMNENHTKLCNSLNQTNQVIERTTNNINEIIKKTVDAEVQSNVSKKTVQCYDVSTSPLPQFISTATSPILLDRDEKSRRETNAEDAKKKIIKGKKALAIKEGWAGFCKPHRVCSPEVEGALPSSNIPSDREAIEKISEDQHTSNSTAPHSQRVLRRVDSRNNIKQISINHKPPIPDKKVSPSSNKDVLKELNKEKTFQKIDTDKLKNRKNKADFSDVDQGVKTTKKSNKACSDEENRNEATKVKYKVEQYNQVDKKDSKKMLIPIQLANQSFSRSCDSSSESDSESVACPTLIPRWLPNSNNFRQRRAINRRNQRRDEVHKTPYQNGSGGWSVTLAGSCYTTLPSDVEMKVIFPKANQQPNSQSDSGLGEESRPRKPNAVECKKCTTQTCKCLSAVKKHGEPPESEREPFLPSALGRKSSKGSSIGHSGSLDQLSAHAKRYDYLPDVNLTSGNKSRPRKPSIQMDRRFSLHCWLPEDKPKNKQKITKMQISESIGHPDGDELSVFGCAIMPEIKPRVPTMSERDLTRIHAAQYYSRTRRC